MSEGIAAALLLTGGVFCLIAGIGLIRLKDVFARMHAATKAGTLGLGLICLGAMVLAESWAQVGEALIVFVFLIGTAPVGAHLIGRAAWRSRVPLDPATQVDDGAEAFRDASPAPRDL